MRRASGALTLGGLLGEVCARFRDREAIAFHEAGGAVVRWSYADLESEARTLAKALIAAGVDKGTRVGLLMGNRPEWVAAAFGVALAGGVLVPINTFFEPPEIDQVLAHSDTAVVLHQRRLANHAYDDQLRDLEARLPYLRRRVCLATRGATTRSWPAPSRSTTAGSTPGPKPPPRSTTPWSSTRPARRGQPKGVLHAHRAAALQSWRFAVQLRLDPAVRVWSAFPFFWTAGFCMVMGATLAAGGCLVLQELFEPGEALSLLESERVTSPHAWPHQLAALESHPGWRTADLSSLRQVVAFTSFGRHPTVQVEDTWSPRAAYGLTETFTIISSSPSDTPPAVRDGNEGAILPGNVVRIVDRETGEPLPAGMSGEIRVKGPTLMKGYLKVAPEAVFDTDGFFLPATPASSTRDGKLHWVGRTSDLIKTGGANVSPVEIETVLLHHPDLVSAQAVGVPHDTLGEVVVVCAVAQPGRGVDEEGRPPVPAWPDRLLQDPPPRALLRRE